MKTATGLTLLAVGAILAFAVRASPPGLNLNITGWVIMLTGVAGVVMPARASGWLRKRVVVRSKPGLPGAAGINAAGINDAGINDAGYNDAGNAPYVLRDPAELAQAILRDAELAGNPYDDSPTGTANGGLGFGAGLASGGPAGGQHDSAPSTLHELLEGRAGRGGWPR